ncbi:MAG: GNAT family N-acetyltransferase [Pirellulales bacterium]|nr:GNAT family N-acetyltransferase [Pirellulales bacterium]
MKITVVDADRLGSEQVALWSEIQRANPSLASPYFRPEYVRAVASVRKGVAVGILEEAGRTVGFFPFQHGRWKIGRPVGTPLCDFQGVVTPPGTPFDAEELIRGCGLATWRFDQLLADQQPFGRFHRTAAPAAFLDLSRGFEAYYEDLRQRSSREVSRIRYRRRAAERRVGAVRFDFHTADSCVFEKLLQWKAAQYVRTGHTNILQFAWVAELLRRIRRHQDEAFAGVLSALYLGDRLAAVHLGMRSYKVLHRWFPAYDPELRQHSPGRILLIELARAAAARGIRRIDDSKGLEQDKTSVMSGSVAVADGSVTCGRLRRALEHARQGTQRVAEVPLLGGPARRAARLSRPLRRWLAFR